MTVQTANLFCKSNLLRCSNLERNDFLSPNVWRVSSQHMQFGKNKGNGSSNVRWGGGVAGMRSKQEKKNLVVLLLFAVSIGTQNMLHQQVDFSSVPLSWIDLLCNKPLNGLFVGVGSKHVSHSTYSLKNWPDSSFSQLAEHKRLNLSQGFG